MFFVFLTFLSLITLGTALVKKDYLLALLALLCVLCWLAHELSLTSGLINYAKLLGATKEGTLVCVIFAVTRYVWRSESCNDKH